MKTKLKLLCYCLLTCALGVPVFAQGTAFTYQGRLNDGANPANGSYDFRFRLDADMLGNTVLSTVFTNSIFTKDGLFITTLDFGPGIFSGSNYWLEVGVRTNGGSSYTVLNPLQKLTPAPSAIFAETASNLSGVLPAAQLGGTLLNTSLPASPVFSGTVTAASGFSGNGAGVTNVNAVMLNGLGSGSFWQLGGNNVSAGQFFGSTNDQPVEFWVNGGRALRLEPGVSGDDAPNVILGSSANFVSGNVEGATIGGGGQNGKTNRITGSGGTISGGNNNVVGNFSGTISGGVNNVAAGNASSVSGGSENYAEGDHASIAGGQGNIVVGDHASVGGGENNTNLASGGVIGGGQQNYIQPGNQSFIGGGVNNLIQTNAFEATIAGGWANVIATNAYQTTIGGGSYNIASGVGATVSGGGGNTADGDYAKVGGGSGNAIARNADHATIGGGFGNQIFDYESTIGGGYKNLINAQDGTIAGGDLNVINTGANQSFIGGGVNNTNIGYLAVVPGGDFNMATSNSFAAGHRAKAIHQGTFVWADSQNADFSSTTTNQFSVRAQGGVRLITGGAGLSLDGLNVLTTGSAGLAFLNANQTFTGRNSFTQGIGVGTSSSLEGNFNINTNTYLFAHTLYLRGETGTDHNHGLAYCGTGETNFAPTVLPDGPVLWGYGGGALGAMNNGAHALLAWNSTSVNVGFTNDTQTSPPAFGVLGNRSQGNPLAYVHNIYPQNLIQAGPALRVVNEGYSPDGALSVSVNVPSTASGSYIAEFGNSGAYVVQIGVDGTVYSKGVALISDRDAKEDFTPVSAQTVLAKVAALPMTEWNYKTDAATQKHIGPMAQDFHAAFGLNGTDDRHISVVDEGGVALAAIQGLNQKLEDGSLKSEIRIQKLEVENAELKTALQELRQQILELKQPK